MKGVRRQHQAAQAAAPHKPSRHLAIVTEKARYGNAVLWLNGVQGIEVGDAQLCVGASEPQDLPLLQLAPATSHSLLHGLPDIPPSCPPPPHIPHFRREPWSPERRVTTRMVPLKHKAQVGLAYEPQPAAWIPSGEAGG